jgi:MFS family permease
MHTTYLRALGRFSGSVRLYLFVVGLISFTFDGGIYSVLFNLYLLRLGHGPEVVGLVNAAGLITLAIASLPAGALGARWGNRRTMVAGLLLIILAGALLPLAERLSGPQQVGWLTMTFVVVHLGLALYFVNGAPLMMAIGGLGERTHIFAVQSAMWSLSAFGGSLVGGLLPDVFAGLLDVPLDHPTAFRYPLLLAAAVLLPGIPAILAIREESVEPPPDPAGNQGSPAALTFPIMFVVAMAAVRLLVTAGAATNFTFFNVYLDAGLGVSTVQIGLLSAMGRLMAVPAALITPLLAARWGNGRVLIWSSLGTALCMVPMALIPNVTAAGLGYMGVLALVSIRLPAFQVYSMELVPKRLRSTMSGANEMAVGLSFSATALVGGYLIARVGYTSLFLGGSFLTLAGALLFWLVFRSPRGEYARQAMVQPQT